MRFTSYHATSVTSPVNPSSATIMIATITMTWPSCSRRNVAVRIHRHDGVVRHRELVEHRDKEPQRGPAAVRVGDRDDGGIGWGAVVARAGLPRLARRHEVQLLTINDGAAVQLVVPGVDQPGCLTAARRRFGDPYLTQVRESETRSGPGHHELHGGDDAPADARHGAALAWTARDRAATVHQCPAHPRTA